MARRVRISVMFFVFAATAILVAPNGKVPGPVTFRAKAQTTYFAEVIIQNTGSLNPICDGLMLSGGGCSSVSCDDATSLAYQDAVNQIPSSCRGDEFIIIYESCDQESC